MATCHGRTETSGLPPSPSVASPALPEWAPLERLPQMSRETHGLLVPRPLVQGSLFSFAVVLCGFVSRDFCPHWLRHKLSESQFLNNLI